MSGRTERNWVNGTSRPHIGKKTGGKNSVNNAALLGRKRLQLLKQVRFVPQRIPSIMRSNNLPIDEETLAPPHAIMRRNRPFHCSLSTPYSLTHVLSLFFPRHTVRELVVTRSYWSCACRSM